MNPDLARKVPIVVTNSSPSTVHAGQQLGFVYVCDECVGGPGMCNEIDLFGTVCKVGACMLRTLSQRLCARERIN